MPARLLTSLYINRLDLVLTVNICVATFEQVVTRDSHVVLFIFADSDSHFSDKGTAASGNNCFELGRLHLANRLMSFNTWSHVFTSSDHSTHQVHIFCTCNRNELQTLNVVYCADSGRIYEKGMNLRINLSVLDLVIIDTTCGQFLLALRSLDFIYWIDYNSVQTGHSNLSLIYPFPYWHI